MLILVGGRATGTTWNEPWHKEVIEDADAFVRAKVTKAAPERVEFDVVKLLAGKEAGKSGAIVGFSKLRFGSYSVREDVFRFGEGREYYLFLKFTDKGGQFKIATPTTGFAATKDGTTVATYRHSYHQAYVPDEVYEMSMVAIFNAQKNLEQDLSPARKYIAEELAKKPADIPDDANSEEFKRFCSQHVALELLYYLGGGNLPELEPFLMHKNPHGQISAVRALGRIPGEMSKPRLLSFIARKDRDAFAKVMAIWALRDMGAKDSVDELVRILDSTEDQKAGFGGNIMDPRIGTSFPESVHAAIKELLTSWNKDVEPAGARLPATKPADEAPMKDQPSTPTSKDDSR